MSRRRLTHAAVDAKLERSVLVLFLCITFYLLALSVYNYAGVMRAGGDAWRTADWLISYAGGFIRRGLFGELVAHSGLNGAAQLWLTFSAQVLVLVSLVGSVWLLVCRSPDKMAVLPLLFSPAALLFPLLDPTAAYRKESLGLLVLAVLALQVQRGLYSKLTLWGGLICYAFAVLSHEANALLAPAIAFMAFELKKCDRIFKGTAGPEFAAASVLVIALFGALISIANPGDANQEQAVCSRLHVLGAQSGICDGAISWLDRSVSDGLSHVGACLRKGYANSYAAILFAAAIPWFFVKGFRPHAAWALIGTFVGVSALFPMAVDWGRWIHMIALSAGLIAAVEQSANNVQIKKLPMWLLVIYLVSWGGYTAKGSVSGGLIQHFHNKLSVVVGG
jgi:hypothetical protein